MYSLYADAVFFQGLRRIDEDLFKACKAKGCKDCGGVLDTANFPRKPRGLGEQEEFRFSLCCRTEGCRLRLTPPSLRFLGRKIYPAWVVILAVEFCQELGLSQQMARQTLARWRNFWRDCLCESHAFIKYARSFLPVGLLHGETPSCLIKTLGFPERESWIRILRFFVPLSDVQSSSRRRWPELWEIILR